MTFEEWKAESDLKVSYFNEAIFKAEQLLSYLIAMRDAEIMSSYPKVRKEEEYGTDYERVEDEW